MSYGVISAGTAKFSGNSIIDSVWVTGGNATTIGGGNTIGYCSLGRDANITGSNTFGVLILTPSNTYTFSTGQTQTFTNRLEAYATPGFPIEIKSDTAGKFTTFFKNGGALCTQYIYMRDLHTAGTCLFYAGRGSNNVDNNVGWNFDFLTPCSPLLKGAYGRVYNDFNKNGVIDSFETPVEGVRFIIQPGNYVAQSNFAGYWKADSIPAGTYTITIDTTKSKWKITCPVTQTFTITDPNILFVGPDFGMVQRYQCTEPDISVNTPFMRRCFSNQKIYIKASNAITATGALLSAYTDVELDSLLILESASMPYTDLGNHIYRVQLGDILPGQDVDVVMTAKVSCAALLNQTLCIKANLYPVQACVLDSIPQPPTGEVVPCNLPWDNSDLKVKGYCQNNTVKFVITNAGMAGTGDMQCYSPVRIFIDNVLTQLDSVKLKGGESYTYTFAATGKTWRLEADQHPLHPGDSHPNATVEVCGDVSAWTPGLVNAKAPDDADPVVDIYCGVVTGSYDPNDKTGYPLGVTAQHFIDPGQHLQYVIRFQNTGTDTAFTVVIRDTLDTNLDILSVVSGVASHEYSFRILGQRVLEWTFNNILLPDSTVDLQGSNGFITFEINQAPGLANGAIIKNKADIYFDYNDPVITNEVFHTINTNIGKTYTFTGDGNWSDAANWLNKLVPPVNLPAGYTIFINPVPTGKCILNVNQYVTNGSSVVVSPGKKLLIPGVLKINKTTAPGD